MVMEDLAGALEKALHAVFGHTDFRNSLQRQAVEAVAQRDRDVFISMPTGAGKSLCYQLPAVTGPSAGVTVVVSPLIALLTNQLQALRELGIPAETINSTMTQTERRRVEGDLMSMKPSTNLLYVTPEQVATEGFQNILRALDRIQALTRFAIDEAHCVSEWGHDFRPDYLKLGKVHDMFPKVPWVALTATASETVFKDIVKQLRLREPVQCFRSSSFRPNLYYDVEFKENLDNVYEDMKNFALRALGKDWECEKPEWRGCGIIYCRTREMCEEVAHRVSTLGLQTKPYHAGLKAKERKENQVEWSKGHLPVIAATISFGMGIDRASVRFVVHWCVSSSVAAYYQESGRAGRDGKKAYCRIYYSHSDRKAISFLLHRNMRTAKKQRKRTAAEAATKSFDNMVAYCEGTLCRHVVLSREFGEQIQKCEKFCDACSKLKALEMRLASFRSSMLTTTTKKFSRDTGFEDLYGGGRRGQLLESRAYGSDDDAGGGDDGTQPLSSLIRDELEKRRGSNKPTATRRRVPKNCPVLEPKCAAIKEVSVEMRVEYFTKLHAEMEKNLATYGVINERPRLTLQDIKNCAAEVELDIFKTKKNIHMYRRALVGWFKSLRDLTSVGDLHESILAYGSKKDIRLENDELKNQCTLLGFLRQNSIKQEAQSDEKKRDDPDGSDMCIRSNTVDIKLEICEDKTEHDTSNSTCDKDVSESSLESSLHCATSPKPGQDADTKIKYFFEKSPTKAKASVSGDIVVCVVEPSGESEQMHSLRATVPENGTDNKKRKQLCESKVLPNKKQCSEQAEHSKLKSCASLSCAVTEKQERAKELEKAAQFINKCLYPMFKAGTITREQFKQICKDTSHKLVESKTVNSQAAKEVLDDYFKSNHK